MLITVRREVKSIDNSVVVHELELAIKGDNRVIYEACVARLIKRACNDPHPQKHTKLSNPMALMPIKDIPLIKQVKLICFSRAKFLF